MRRVCSIPGCEKPSRARGWCMMHHRRWRIHGSPHVKLSPGRKRREDDEPCPRGHIHAFYSFSQNGGVARRCILCQRMDGIKSDSSSYYWANRDRIRRQQRDYFQRNKERRESSNKEAWQNIQDKTKEEAVNLGLPWTLEEWTTLKGLLEEGFSSREIALVMGRSYSSIKRARREVLQGRRP